MIVFKGGTASFDDDHETFVSIHVHACRTCTCTTGEPGTV